MLLYLSFMLTLQPPFVSERSFFKKTKTNLHQKTHRFVTFKKEKVLSFYTKQSWRIIQIYQPISTLLRNDFYVIF